MNINDIIKLLDATNLTPDLDCERELHSACGSDMMSDVLAYVKDQAVLLTGLNNPQVIRTANMMDMVCIVFVRNKEPSEAMLDLARDFGLVVMRSSLRAFEACGRLYEGGLGGKEGDAHV